MGCQVEYLKWRDWCKSFLPVAFGLGFVSVFALAGSWAGVWLMVWILTLVEFVDLLSKIGCFFQKKTICQRIAGVFVKLAIVSACFVMMLLASTKLSQKHIAAQQENAPLQPAITTIVHGMVDYRGEIHTHSYLSHDSRVPLEEVAAAAKANGIRWVMLTDHISALEAGKYPHKIGGVVLIYGSEHSWHHQGAHFEAPIDGSQKFHAYGHIEEFREWDEHWDALELVNFHANAFNVHAPWRHKLETFGTLLGNVLFWPSSTYESLTRVLPENLARWQELAEREKRPIPIFAGPDTHQNVRLFGQQLDPYPFMLGLVSTHVWIPEDQPLNQDTIIEAVKTGRTYIAFDYLGDPTGFQFLATHDGQRFFTGDTVAKPVRLWVSHHSAKNTEVRLFHDNALMWTYPVDTNVFALDYPTTKPGFWRAEIWRDGKPWIISGQILVK